MDESATLCPVVNPEQRQRIREAIDRGVDGRGEAAARWPRRCRSPRGPAAASSARPSSMASAPEMFVAREEIFGPVVSVLRAKDLDEAITLANRSRYGNSVSLFTQSGAAARDVPRAHPGRHARHQPRRAGADGVLLLRRLEESFFGDLHAHGPDAVAFYTRKKVVTERWFGGAPKEGWV